MRGYLELIILQATEIDLSYVSAFILKRVDNLVDGLVESSEEPILHEESLENFFVNQSSLRNRLKSIFKRNYWI